MLYLLSKRYTVLVPVDALDRKMGRGEFRIHFLYVDKLYDPREEGMR